MIAIDTNILVRYIVEPETVHGRIACDVLEQQLLPSRPGFVSSLVIAEMLWVLESNYGVDSKVQRDVVKQLLDMPQLLIQHADQIELAIGLDHKDLADCILHEIGRARGCSHTVTFDRKFARLDGVELAQRQ